MCVCVCVCVCVCGGGGVDREWVPCEEVGRILSTLPSWVGWSCSRGGGEVRVRVGRSSGGGVNSHALLLPYQIAGVFVWGGERVCT